MDAVRGVTDQRQPRVGVAVHQHGGERVAPAAAEQADRAKVAAQAPCQLVGERRRFQPQNAFHGRRPLGPDDGGEVGRLRIARHRQLRERAGGKEMFERGAVMRDFMADRADDAGLPVWQVGHGNAGLATQGRGAAFSGHHQAGTQRGAAGDGHRRTFGRARDFGLGRREHVQIGQGSEPGVQRHAQASRLDHPAEGFVPHVARLEMQEQS